MIKDYTLEDLKNLPLVETCEMPIVTYMDMTDFTRTTHPVHTYKYGAKEFIEKHPMCKIFILLQDGKLFSTDNQEYYSPRTFYPTIKVIKTIRACAIPLTSFMYEYEMNKHKRNNKLNNRRLLLIKSL